LYADLLHQLGDIRGYQTLYADAREKLQSALESHKKLLGPNHSKVAGDIFDYARICRLQGEYAECKKLNQEALQLRKVNLGPQVIFYYMFYQIFER
jgi:hypothetical protein